MNKQRTIEEEYQKLTPKEHILKRPDTYIGSVEFMEQKLWVQFINQVCPSPDSEKFVEKDIKFVPGLFKIFDEILVNAADNY